MVFLFNECSFTTTDMGEFLRGMSNTVTIKKNYEFQRVYKKGKFYVGHFLILYCYKNNTGINRIGITVGKKIGKSVRRNRFKRLIRESYHFFEGYVAGGYDLIFVARASDAMPEFYEVKKEMKYLFKRLKLFNEEKWNCQKQ